MIIKNFELNKINIKTNKYFLLYGQNKGQVNEVINNHFTNYFNEGIYKYEENEIIVNKSSFFDQILNTSFFDKEKLIIISRVTDKSRNIIEEIQSKKNEDVVFVLIAEVLEKKSKLRKFFEDSKNSICIAFYPDTVTTLNKIINNFFKEKKILISQSNINYIIGKCNNDRECVMNELKKIELLSISKKKITTEDLIKIVNLNENHSIFELVDNCLLKDQKKIVNIINENHFTTEDNIKILRTFLIKCKKILKLSTEFEKSKDINTTIANAKPPIFWKEKELVKRQILNWGPNKIHKLILNINSIELQIKKNNSNQINIILDFMFEQSSNKTNNYSL